MSPNTLSPYAFYLQNKGVDFYSLTAQRKSTFQTVVMKAYNKSSSLRKNLNKQELYGLNNSILAIL